MTKSQELELKLSESRSAITTMLDSPPEKREATYEASLKKATEQHKTLETEFRAALASESSNETRRTEQRAPVAQKAELRHFIADQLNIKKLDGAEAELAAELKLGHGQVPTELLFEKRADAVATSGTAATQTNQQPTQPRIFPRMVGSRIGVEMPTVPVGKPSFPILTDGASGTAAAAGAEVDAEAVTFSTKSLSPIRVTARYLFNAEDTLVMPDFEQTLRRDLSTALAQKMDTIILSGSGTAPEPAGFFTAAAGLPQPGTTPVRADGAAYFAGVVGDIAAQLDGLYAHGLNDINLLIGHETQSFMVQSFRSAETDVSVVDYLNTRIGSLFSSDQVAAPAANNQKALIYKSGAGVRAAVAPIWQASQLTVDPYSKSSSGQIALTLHAFFNFAILRGDAYKVLSFRTKYGVN